MEKKEVVLNCPSDSFTYLGKIKVSLKNKSGDRTYFTKEFHNSGRWPLFLFFATCLAGDYGIAEDMRPRFINVFDFGLSDDDRQPPLIADNASQDENKIDTWFNVDNCVSLIAYPMMSKPDVTHIENEIGSSKITFKFTIPFTQIELKQTNAIEGFALYSKQTKKDSTDPASLDNISNPLAYFFLTDDDGNVTNLLSDLGSLELGEEYNLYVEWVLTIVNTQKGDNYE